MAVAADPPPAKAMPKARQSVNYGDILTRVLDVAKRNAEKALQVVMMAPGSYRM